MTESNAGPNPEQTAHAGQDHWQRGCQEAKQAFGEAKQAFSKTVEAFSPPSAAREHFRQSRIEFLKGMRELIDHQIDRLSKGPHKGTHVTVE